MMPANDYSDESQESVSAMPISEHSAKREKTKNGGDVHKNLDMAWKTEVIGVLYRRKVAGRT